MIYIQWKSVAFANIARVHLPITTRTKPLYERFSDEQCETALKGSRTISRQLILCNSLEVALRFDCRVECSNSFRLPALAAVGQENYSDRPLTLAARRSQKSNRYASCTNFER
jgi:hypothetical protein